MQNLHDFLTDYIKESFASDTIRNLFMSTKLRARSGRYWDGSLPMWDKIKDNDLTKLNKDEAMKRMRSRKEPGYLIWFRNDRDDQVTMCGITWGCDVVMTSDGYYKGITASSIAYDSEGAYEVEDAGKFMRGDLQKSRREAKAGATALMDYDKIKADNLERYEKELAKLNNPGLDAVTKIFKDAMEVYKNVVDKYVAKFVSIMQEGNVSFYAMQRQWEELNKVVMKMTEDMHMYEYLDKGKMDKSAMEYYKKVSEAAKKIENTVNDFETSSKE